MASWETRARRRAAKAVFCGGALLLPLLVVTACGSAKESSALGTGPGRHAMDGQDGVAQLSALERPLVRELKLAFVDLSRSRDERAAERLERAADVGGRLFDWVDSHRDFAEANAGSIDCIEESVHELHERVEQTGERLREERASEADRRELRIRLAEVVNCINTSD
jgi:hypothetical protein